MTTSATSESLPPSPAAPDARQGRCEPIVGIDRTKPRGPKYWMGRAWLAAFGWKVGGGLPKVPRAVVIASPHTSNWDLPFALAIAWVIGIEIHWLGKKSLFRPPLGWLTKALNGIPVDRSKRNNLVADAARKLREAEHMFLMIPPEGTRGIAKRWKTGFYYIAAEAGVPIVLGYLDYTRKEGGLGALVWPSGDLRADFRFLQEFYGPVEGKYNHLKGPVTLGDEPADP